EHYLPDDSVGARIGSAALRSALERCLETGESAFHVHMHDVGVRLRFSSTDVHGLIELLPSFYGAAPQGPHGALLFSADTCSGAFWNPMLGRLVPMDSISVVGYPFRRSVGDGK
ncbi:MAG: hypothetical protein KGK30_05880, partial [Elusimicrobia bacterium]|nr:hypothetical protein [Elusimicrobiota bacterium]